MKVLDRVDAWCILNSQFTSGRVSAVRRAGVLLTAVVSAAVLLSSCGPSKREHQQLLTKVEALEDEVADKDARIEFLEKDNRRMAGENRKMTAQLSEKPEVIEKVKT